MNYTHRPQHRLPAPDPSQDPQRRRYFPLPTYPDRVLLTQLEVLSVVFYSKDVPGIIKEEPKLQLLRFQRPGHYRTCPLAPPTCPAPSHFPWSLPPVLAPLFCPGPSQLSWPLPPAPPTCPGPSHLSWPFPPAPWSLPSVSALPICRGPFHPPMNIVVSAAREQQSSAVITAHHQ